MKNKNTKIKLRYGENPSQRGYLISDKKNSIFNYQISGKQISYNNLIDIDSGLKCLKEFLEPTSIILKHTNPCGIASAKNIEILSVSNLMGEAIRRISNSTSVSYLFK